MPSFFSGPEDLRKQWSHPITRQHLLDILEQEGFAEDKLEMMRRMLAMEKCDLLDVLLYIAYETPAVERIRRVELVKQDWIKHWTRAQADFLTIILDYYAKNGYKELGEDKLSSFIDIKYGSTSDAARALQMGAKEIRQSYLDLQHELYDGPAIQQLAVQGDVYFQGNTSVGTIHG
jgi:type I restriction enzyme R subunit